MDLLKRCFLQTVFILATLCSWACQGGEPPSSHTNAPDTRPPAINDISTTPSESSGTSKEVPPPSVPPETTTKEGSTPERESIKSFAVYTLSRGAGVPDKAREAMEQVRKSAERDESRGVRVTMTRTWIGLEGETRLCIEYENARDGTRAYQRAASIVKGVDLVNLEVAPCAETTK